jgi:hypothetical protein
MYRDDLAATHARADSLQQELENARTDKLRDQQRIAALTARVHMLQQMLARHGAAPEPRSYIHAPRGGTILALGVCSVILCSLLGPIAWAMGNEELRRIAEGQTSPVGHMQATAGRLCGIIATAFMAIVFVVLFVVLTVPGRW